ncbi:MAG: nicotinamide riboside transporter PnuC [Bacteroidales bacterium]|nr:nicotinamide riboside transporter PnuC [Bacteroidales bacterium]
MNGFSDWLLNNWIELFGSISGLIYIYFSLRRSIWLWPVGLITSAAFVVVFYEARLFADMALQLYYCFASIYGWIFWLFGKKRHYKSVENKELPISRLTFFQWLISAALVVILTLIYLPLGNAFHASFPIVDGLVTAASIVATWMLARKILDQWLIWIGVDALSAIMLIAKEKYLAAGLMIIYTILAVLGYLKWLKDFRKQNG